MAAPKGNQFWKLRSKHGRDKLFASPELLWNAACEYFHWCETHPLIKIKMIPHGVEIIRAKVPVTRPYTVSGLCAHLGYTRSHYYRCLEMSENDTLPEIERDYYDTLMRAHMIISVQNNEGAMIGAFNPNIAIRRLDAEERRKQKRKKTARPDQTVKIQIINGDTDPANKNK